MTPEEAREFFGTQANIARVLGIGSPSVCEWFEKGFIPEVRQYQLQIASRGKLKANLPADRTRLKSAA